MVHCWVLGSVLVQRTRSHKLAEVQPEDKRGVGRRRGEDIIEIQMANSYMKKTLNSYTLLKKNQKSFKNEFYYQMCLKERLSDQLLKLFVVSFKHLVKEGF